MKKCTINKIRNPETGRCVSRTGKIGRSVVNASLTPSDCDVIGMKQFIGTCWFNAIFNGFLLSERCYFFFLKKYNALPKDEKKKIINQKKSSVCSVNIKKYDFYYYFYKYHHNQSQINSKYNAQDLINKLDIRSYGWEVQRQAYEPSRALLKILPIILNSDEYCIYLCRGLDVIPYLGSSQKSTTKFLFVITSDGAPIRINDLRLLTLPREFILDHTEIIIWDNLGAHEISGYICDNEYYIYDSLLHENYKLDWRVNKNVKKSSYLASYVELFSAQIDLTHIGYTNLCYMKL